MPATHVPRPSNPRRPPVSGRAQYFRLVFAAAVLVLGACAAPQTEAVPANDARDATTASMESTAPPEAARTLAQAEPPAETVSERGPLDASEPAPPAAAADPEDAAAPVQVDMSCRTDADCTVKDVGNCCGFYPACVNVNSPTDPEGVKAACARSGMMSVCGFRDISACQCVAGSCQAADDGSVQIQ